KPLSQFLFDELTSRVDMASAEGRARFVAEAKPLIAQIAAPALGAMLRHRMAELARLTAEEIAALMPQPVSAARKASPPVRTSRRTVARPEARLLGLVLHRLDLVAGIDELDAGFGRGHGGAARGRGA